MSATLSRDSGPCRRTGRRARGRNGHWHGGRRQTLSPVIAISHDYLLLRLEGIGVCWWGRPDQSVAVVVDDDG